MPFLHGLPILLSSSMSNLGESILESELSDIRKVIYQRRLI